MDRPGSIIYSNEFLQLKKEIEAETGFTCYEVQPGDQTTFFGTSDKYEALQEMIAGKFNTGTIVYLMDTGKRYMYSRYKDTWYEIV